MWDLVLTIASVSLCHRYKLVAHGAIIVIVTWNAAHLMGTYLMLWPTLQLNVDKTSVRVSY